jgi:hypothetical protein
VSAEAPRVKFGPGRPATLGSTAAAGVRIIVWCKACGHQTEPDPAAMVERYRAELPVLVCRDRLSCSRCGGQEIDMVLTRGTPVIQGYRPRAFRSHRSFACAARIVCYCMFETASGPPQASGLT